MFIKGDAFLIDNKMYKIRNAVEHPEEDNVMYWLEQVFCGGLGSGGVNIIMHYDELLNLDYIGSKY